MLHDLKFPLHERLRSHDPLYDVATFNILPTEVELLRTHGKVVLTGSQAAWPPAPPQQGRGVFFVGFPGGGRQLRPYRGGGLVEVNWEGYTALAIATSVSDTGITVHYRAKPLSRPRTCETIEANPRAWKRTGAQNLLLTDRDRDQIRRDKRIAIFERRVAGRSRPRMSITSY